MVLKTAKFIIIITIFCSFFNNIQQLTFCDTSFNNEDLMMLKEILCEELYDLVKTPEFCQEYGCSKKNPAIITRYYLEVIATEPFIRTFLNQFPWETYQKTLNYTSTLPEIKTYLINELILYIKIKEKLYIQDYFLCTFFESIPKFLEIIKLKYQLITAFQLHPEALEKIPIITPHAFRHVEILENQFNNTIVHFMKSFCVVKITLKDFDENKISFNIVFFKFINKTFVYHRK